MNEHNEFRFVPESEFRETSHGKLPIPPEGKALSKPNAIAYQASALAYRIRAEVPDPKLWKARIEAAPEEVRECLREYLRQMFREMQARARREAVGKRSDAGDEAIATLAKVVGHD